MYARLFLFSFVIAVALSCSEAGGRITEVKLLPGYPSGSGLAYHEGRIYIMGDDAAYMLVADSMLNVVDSIQLFESVEKRIAKERKPDTEAITLVNKNRATTLLVMCSGSLSPFRDSCYVISLPGREIKKHDLDTFYNRLKKARINELNIEGATATPAGIVLANRGNKSFPKNHLIVVSNSFWKNQSATRIRLIKTGTNSDTSTFNGISGLDYSYRSDQLLLSVSTENTYSSYADGSIGKSYLWIINDFSSKKRLDVMNPDRIIDLEEIDQRFKGQKIESVCIISESKKEKVLILVADDDKGGTVLFKLVL